MKKTVLFFAMFAVAMFVSAQSMLTLQETGLTSKATITAGDGQKWWGYWDGGSYNTYRTSNAETFHMAFMIRPEQQLLTGKKIYGVRFFVPSSSIDSKLYIWLSTDKPSSPTNANITYKEIALSDLSGGKMNDVLFDEPYTIGTSNVYIGYTITTTAASVNVVPGCSPAGTDACWIKMSASYNSWTTTNAGTFALAMQALFEGEFVENAVKPVSMTDAIVKPSASQKYTIKLQNYSPSGVKKINYIVQFPDTTFPEKTKSLTNYTGMGYTEVELTIKSPSKLGVYHPTVTITKVNGEDNYFTGDDAVVSNTVTVVDHFATKRVVEEEFTGMWCGWCPRGIVGMDMAEAAYPDQYIGIAVHSGDKLVASDNCYNSIISSYVSGFPSAMIDRQGIIDPYFGSASSGFGMKTDIKKRLSQACVADLELTPYWADDDKTSVNITTNVQFIYDLDSDSPYRLAYVMVADSLTSSSFYQSNYYSGSSGDSNLSYWYSAGGTVTGVTFNHVPIKGAGVSSGLSGSVPAPWTTEEPVVHKYTMDLPSDATLVQNKDYIKIVALLINTKTNLIENAIAAHIADATGITTISADGANENAQVQAIYNLKGQRLTQPQKGVNVFQYTDGSSRRVLIR